MLLASTANIPICIHECNADQDVPIRTHWIELDCNL